MGRRIVSAVMLLRQSKGLGDRRSRHASADRDMLVPYAFARAGIVCIYMCACVRDAELQPIVPPGV